MRTQPWLPRVFLGLVLMLLLGPFVVVFVAAFGAERSLRFPPSDFSLQWFGHVVRQRMFIDAFVVSIEVAVVSTVAALVLGIPLAYASARYQFRGKAVVEMIATTPVIVPQLVVGLALLRYFVLTAGLPVLPSLMVGHTVLLVPYAVRVVLASLANLPVEVEQAAVSLGASRIGAFFRVVLPNIRSGVLAASILSFITSFNDVPISLFLTGPGIATLPIQMLLYMEYYYDPSIAALSTLLILFTVLLVQGTERFLGLSRYV